MLEFKKPRLGQWVYVFNFYGTVFRDQVIMKGKDSFAISMAFRKEYPDGDYEEVPNYEQPIQYGSYGYEWFTRLSDAKKYLKAEYPAQVLTRTEENRWDLGYYEED